MNSVWIALNMVKRTIGRKKGFILFIIVPPVVVALIIGLMNEKQDSTVTIAYVNSDKGMLGAHLVKDVADKENFRLVEIATIEQAQERVLGGKAAGAFVIPFSFTESVTAGDASGVRLLELNMNEATFTLKFTLEQSVRRLVQAVQTVEAAGFRDRQYDGKLEALLVQLEKRQVKAKVTDYDLYVNPAAYTSMGLLIMFIMGLIGSSVAVMTEDRANRTMARIYSAPVRSWHIAIGNFLGSFLIGTLQIVTVLLFSRYVLGFEFGIPFAPQFIVLEFFMLAALGMTTAVAGLVKNRRSVSTYNTLIITPTCMLGGCFWPSSIMPDFMQKIANVVPQKWAMEMIERLAGGGTIAQQWLNLAVLALFAIVLLGFGASVLRPDKESI